MWTLFRGAIHAVEGDWNFTCFARTRAVDSAPLLSSPFSETRDEDKKFPYTCRFALEPLESTIARQASQPRLKPKRRSRQWLLGANTTGEPTFSPQLRPSRTPNWTWMSVAPAELCNTLPTMGSSVHATRRPRPGSTLCGPRLQLCQRVP